MAEVREVLMRELKLTDPGALQKVMDAACVETVRRGTLLVEVGQPQPHLYILLSGILRGFIIRPDGRDITDCFAFRCGDVAVGCGTLDQPSLVNIEALSQAQVLKIPMGVVRELLQDPAVMQIYLDRLSQSLMRHWELKILMYHCSALQRYQWFLKTHAGLPKGISGKYIASYLGMNPVTLSRLRHREDGRAAEERP